MSRLPYETDAIQAKKGGFVKLSKETAMYERLTETIRVPLNISDLPSLYALVLPCSKPTQFREFFLVDDTTNQVLYMFGCSVETDKEAVILAQRNAPDYISILLENQQILERALTAEE